MRISASQIETFDGERGSCPRRWWFQTVQKMPRLPKGSLVFGSVLHACLERWLSADDRGRVPDPVSECLHGQHAGDPVEVFPEGWEKHEESGIVESVTPTEARLIRKLVEQAVERGIVQRDPSNVVEREVGPVPVIDGVDLLGFVDVFVRREDSVTAGPETGIPEIHDHKTFGQSGERFLKRDDPESPNYVGDNQQLLTYAAATSIEDGHDGAVVVRHNQFPKYEDGRGVRVVSAVVPPERVREHWAWVQGVAAEMLKVREIKKWDDVPGPKSLEACSAYGGCQFQEVCSRRETPEAHRERAERLVRGRIEGRRPDLGLTRRKRRKERQESMATEDIFTRVARMKQERQARQDQARQEASPPAPAPVNGGRAEPAPEAPAGDSPPWADSRCPACVGKGFTSKGRPCPICDATAKRAGRPTSAAYVATQGADGGWTAVARPEHAKALEAAGLPLEWAQGQQKARTTAPPSMPQKPPSVAPTPVQEQVAEENPALPSRRGRPRKIVETVPQVVDAGALNCPDVTGASPELAKDKPKPATDETRGRPKLGLTILIGAAQLKGPQRPVVLAQSLLEQLGAELAREMGAASYWELDPFKRRDRLRLRAEAIAESLGRSILVVPNLADPDTAALVAALIPHADVVVEGLR